MIFDRNSVVHPFDTQVAGWLDNTLGFDGRAIGLNLIHDHRVSEAREDRLITCFKCCNDDLRNAIHCYFLYQVRRASPPDFLSTAINSQNIVTGNPDAYVTAQNAEPGTPSTGTPVINTRDALLVHALILNGLQHMFRATLQEPRFRDELLKYFPFGVEDPEFERALDDAMTTRENKAFVEFVLRVVQFWTPGFAAPPEAKRYPFHPTWAAFWEEYKMFADCGGYPSPADRWLQALGIRPSPTPEWVILLGYTAQEAGNLVRPTQLDSGWYKFHFPSPKHLAPERGGIPVDLSSAKPRHVISEFIHEQIAHTKDHYERINCRFGKTTPWTVDLPQARQRHYDRLVRQFGIEVRQWMPTPT